MIKQIYLIIISIYLQLHWGIVNTLEFQFQTGSPSFPTLTNSPSVTYKQNAFGIYMHNDAPEFVATAGESFDMTKMPFKMEIFYYSCKNDSHYIYSTSDYGTLQEEYFSIKAYPGFTYVVFMIDKYGIGDTPRIKMSLHVRNNNVMSYQSQYTTLDYEERDLIGLPQVPTVGTTRYLFGHKGQSDKVKTSLHLKGIFRLFKTTETASATDMTISSVDTQWGTLYSMTNPTTLIGYLNNDLSYIAKLDFENIQKDDQVIPDNIDATYTLTAPTYGTNSLVYGTTDGIDSSSDPLYVPNHGTLFSSGKYAYGADKIALTEAQAVDFTIEVWYRINTNVNLLKGTLQTLILKAPTLNSGLSGSNFGIQISDQYTRIHLMGKFIDIPTPSNLFDIKTKTFERSWINNANGNKMTEIVNQEWRMIAVNYRRSQQYLGTHAYVYFDLDQPIELFFPGAIFSALSTATDDIFVGYNFEGLIRSIFVYQHFPMCTYFAKNSQDSNKYYENNRYQYEFLQINDLQTTNPTCNKRTFPQSKCHFCTKHETGSDYPSNYCYSTCPLNSYSTSCRECDSRCLFCTNYLPDSCLLCNTNNNISDSQPLYTNSIGWCTRDFGYYRNASMPRGIYEKCDSRCLVCQDSSNYCERCVKDAFKIDGSRCVWECPPGYIQGVDSGLCEVDQELIVTQNQLKNSISSYTQSTLNDLVQKCEPMQYLDVKSNQCKNCHESCLTCSQGGDNFCTSCKIGYFLSLSDNKCLLCNTTAQQLNFKLGALSECVEICGKGRNFGLLQCDDGNLLNNDGCNSQCQVENGWSCRGGNITSKDICSYQSTQLVGNEVTEYNQIIIKFNRPVLSMSYNVTFKNNNNSRRVLQSLNNSSNNISSEDILGGSSIDIQRNVTFEKSMLQLFIQDRTDPYAKWEEYTGNWGIDNSFDKDDYPSNLIPIYTDMNMTGVDYSIYRIKIQFSSSSVISDINNQLIDSNQQQYQYLIANLNKIQLNQVSKGYNTNDSQYERTNALGVVVILLLTSSAIFTILNSLVMFKPVSLTIAIVLALQQFYLTSLINLTNSNYNAMFLTNVYYESFKFAMFNWDFEAGREILTDLLVNDFTLNNVYGDRYTQAGYYYNSSIVNMSDILWFWSLYFVAFIPLALAIGYIMKLQCRGNEKLLKYSSALIYKPVFSASSLFFIVFFLPMILPCILEIHFFVTNQDIIDNLNDSTNSTKQSYEAAVFLMILTVFGFLYLLITILLNKNIVDHPKIKLMYGSLFTPFKHQAKCYMLYPLYISKSLISAVVIVLSSDSWETQTFILMVLSLTMGVFITYVRPFKLMSLNMLTSSLEFILVGHFLIYFIANYSYSQEDSTITALDIVMIYDVIACILFFIGTCYDSVISLYKYHYWMKTGKLPQKYGQWLDKIQINKKNDINDTSSIVGLLDKNNTTIKNHTLDNSRHVTKLVKENTFMDALEKQEDFDNINQDNNSPKKNKKQNKKQLIKKPKKKQKQIKDNDDTVSPINIFNYKDYNNQHNNRIEDPQNNTATDNIYGNYVSGRQKSMKNSQNAFDQDNNVFDANNDSQDENKNDNGDQQALTNRLQGSYKKKKNKSFNNKQ